MKRMTTVLALAASMLLATASLAVAAPGDSAICVNGENHGAHIVGYVEAGIAAGGGAAHFGVNATPGASFCQGDNNARNLPARP